MRALRLGQGPIIHPAMHLSIGANINGPSLIRVPDWIENRLGKYYLYFAAHYGEFIRLAYADGLLGPWKIYAPGVLHLTATACAGHVASPDVHIDGRSRRLRMYFHGPYGERQRSFLAWSLDGLKFESEDIEIGPPYMRVFEHKGVHYALAKDDAQGGVLTRSPDGVTPFVVGPLLPARTRHCAARVLQDVLDVYFTRIGDCPEQILVGRIDLRADWTAWQVRRAHPVLKPDAEYEGRDAPLESSRPGAALASVRELRDPCIFEDDGRCYLLYSVAGEQGIAIAEVKES